ncbi:polyketide synthase docking domain-containing protein [Kitasatospora sp. NPDC096128]
MLDALKWATTELHRTRERLADAEAWRHDPVAVVAARTARVRGLHRQR